jgi:hypothetical protein
MPNTQRDVDTLLERAAAQIRDTSPEDRQVEEAAARVWDRLTSDGARVAAVAAEVEEIRGCDDYQALIPAYLSGTLPEARSKLLEDHSRECVPCRRALKEAREGKPVSAPARSRRGAKVVTFPYMKWALAAAAVLAGVLLAPALLDMLGPAGPAATVATLDGPLFRVAESSLPVSVGDQIREGEVLRAGREGGSVIELRDGSLVELRARSEVSIDEGRRGTTIELERGSVIVQAAEQRSRHLYVATDECLVSVTGTIFSVNHGTKGSRVSVIEGEVRVDYSGDEAVLYPGEQLVTSNYLSQVPFDTEIGWSRDLDQYLGLLAEYSQLRRDIHDAVPRPGLRYDSRLLGLMPEGTVFYAALPNLGDTITETRRVLRERLDQSPALADWWRSQGYDQFEPMADEIIQRLGEFGDQLGEELAIGGEVRPGDGSEVDLLGPLVLAEVVDSEGLRDFVERQLAEVAAEHGEDVDVVFLDDPFAPTVGAGDGALYLWIHSDLVAASPILEQIRQVARVALEGQHNPFTDSSFYDGILALYAEGADILVAGDLEALVSVATAEEERDGAGEKGLKMFEKTGFRNVKHLMAEQKHLAGNTHHRVAVTFSEARTGLASWLAAPAPMGSLDFISPEAKFMAAFVFKDPVALLDDLSAITGDLDGFGGALDHFEKQHGLDLRDDFAATLGGEIAIAVDGPLLPSPAWKVVLEVYDPARFQWTVEEALAEVNRQLAQNGQEPLALGREDSGGRTFYRLPIAFGGAELAIHYTFVEGYLVMAPNRALLDRAIRFRNSGYTIAAEPKFTALLPADSYTNFSALVYQDVGSVMQSVAERMAQGQVSPEQQQVLDELRGEAQPTLGYAYGETDRIIFAASTHGDAFSGILLRLMGLQNPLGFEQIWQEQLQGLM